MSAPTRERNIGVVQFLAIIVVAVAVFLAWDFGRRILDTLRLIETENQVERQLRQAQDANAKLKDLKTYVQTDEMVEKTARNELHWTRPNEKIGVPIATPVATPQPAVVIPPPAPPLPRPFWEDWLDAIFGAPPQQ
jgi:cell division protein FtsB